MCSAQPVPLFFSKMAKLEELEEVDLSGNMLKTVPTTIMNCRRMHTLIAHSNSIEVFPEVMQLMEMKVRRWRRHGCVRHIAHHYENEPPSVLCQRECTHLLLLFSVCGSELQRAEWDHSARKSAPQASGARPDRKPSTQPGP